MHNHKISLNFTHLSSEQKFSEFPWKICQNASEICMIISKLPKLTLEVWNFCAKTNNIVRSKQRFCTMQNRRNLITKVMKALINCGFAAQFSPILNRIHFYWFGFNIEKSPPKNLLDFQRFMLGRFISIDINLSSESLLTSRFEK